MACRVVSILPASVLPVESKSSNSQRVIAAHGSSWGKRYYIRVGPKADRTGPAKMFACGRAIGRLPTRLTHANRLYPSVKYVGTYRCQWYKFTSLSLPVLLVPWIYVFLFLKKRSRFPPALQFHSLDGELCQFFPLYRLYYTCLTFVCILVIMIYYIQINEAMFTQRV